MTRGAFGATIKITTPVFFGYIAIGIPFGLLLVNAGYPVAFAPFMSAVMYAGAGQYMAVGLFAAGAGLPAIVAAMLLLNIRHCVYGLSLIERFKGTGRWKPYLVFALTDETYALLAGSEPPAGMRRGDFYGIVSLANHCYWMLGTCIGAVAGSVLPFSFAGVDFALTALFAVLLIDQLKKTRDVAPVVVGAAAAVVAGLCVPARHVLLASLALGIAALIAVRRRDYLTQRDSLRDNQDEGAGNNSRDNRRVPGE